MASHCALLCLVVAFAFVSGASGALECNAAVVAQVEDFDIENVRSSPSDSVHMVVTDSAEEAKFTALCHVACGNYIMDTSNGEGNNPNGSRDENGDSGMNGTMPEGGSENMTDTLLPMEPLDLGMTRYNCAQVKKYLDCRTGCIAQSKGLANCAATCSGRCDSLCGSSLGCFGFDSNRCGVSCMRDDCEEGCQQFSQFSNSTMPRPTDPPELIRLNNQELYDVSIPSELVLEGKPSLVYRIETQPGEYVYQWKVDIMYDLPRVVVTEFLLDLSAFVGRSIDVSFAYATEAGLSAYSDPTEIRLFNEVVPVSPSDTVYIIVTERQDHCENVALCHITCLPGPPDMTNNSGNSSEMENEMGNECSNGTGLDSGDTCEPSFSCAQVKKYLDCRTGCIAQSMGQADCATTCSGRCDSICGSSLGCFGFDGNRCGVQCNREDCSTGCQKGSQLTSDRLMAPMTPPQLERMPQNIYDVIIPSDSEIEIFATSSPVFRIATETGEVYYQWMVDIVFELPDVSIMEYQLDLSAYTGQRLNISYAFATDVGISEYSQNAVVQVPEQCVVVALTTDQVLVKSRRDDRAGFFTHSVLDVSWCPTPCVEGVSHYVITRNPDGGNCGGTVTETVNASTSNVLLMSNSPTRLPLPCIQTVQIQTVLVDGSTLEVTRSIRLAVASDDDSIPAVKSLNCPIEFDPERQQYHVDFEFLVPFSPAALSHIEAFAIRVDVLRRLRDSANPFSVIQVGIVIDTMEASVDQTLYSYTTYLELFREADIFYHISVEVNWMSPSGPGRSDICSTTDAVAPPFPVQSITITDVRTFTVSQLDTQRVEASVSIEWEEPELLIEGVPIAFYEVYFGTVPLQPTEDGRNIDTFSGTQLNGSVVKIFDDVPISDETLTTFVQIRSYQYPNIPSSWSEAEEVVLVLSQGVIVTLNNTGTLYAGTGLTLTCTVILDSNVDSNVMIAWSEMPGGRSTLSPAMRGSGTNYTGSLTISPLADQDDGTYTCTGTGTTATTSDDITITVLALPAPVVTISTSSSGPTAGQSYLLTCLVRTVPHLVVSPGIQWTRQDGRVLNSSTGYELWLSFNSLMSTDSSVYTCQASVTITGIVAVSGEASNEILLTKPSGAPEMLETVVGEREVTFSWSPLPVAQHRGYLTSYTLSCSPSPSSLPQSSSQSGPLTVTGFSPGTSYSCSVVANNGFGSGPPSTTDFTIQPDYLNFQLHFTEIIGDCHEFVSDNRDAKLEDITNAVLRKLTTSCAECSRDIIDMELFRCFPESPSHVTYRARLAGTSERDSGSLISLIEEWVRGGADIGVTGLLMIADTKCSVEISSFTEAECSVAVTSTTTSSAISPGGIIGGVVAVILIIAVSIIIVVVLILKLRRRDPRKTKYEVNSPLTTQRGNVIATTSNTAYEMTKLGGEMSGREYEVVGVAPDPPISGKAVEVMYKMPSAPPSHQPLPAIPLTETTPTGGDVRVASEEEDGVYDNIPGDQ